MKTDVIIFRDPNDPLYITLAMHFKAFCHYNLNLKEGELKFFGWRTISHPESNRPSFANYEEAEEYLIKTFGGNGRAGHWVKNNNIYKFKITLSYF